MIAVRSVFNHICGRTQAGDNSTDTAADNKTSSNGPEQASDETAATDGDGKGEGAEEAAHAEKKAHAKEDEHHAVDDAEEEEGECPPDVVGCIQSVSPYSHRYHSAQSS